MDTFELKRDIKIEDAYDLVVAGGGPAGCAAAIAAGRLGVKVLLVEAMGCLGGMGTSGLVPEFDPLANGEIMLVGGIMREIVEKMYERGFMPDCAEPQRWRRDDHRYTPFKVEGLKLLYDELVLDANVEIRFFTRVIDADFVSSGTINGVVIQNMEGYSFIKAKTFIDATGDAILANMCGVVCREAGRDTQDIMPPTLCSIFAGIDWSYTNFIYRECRPETQEKYIEQAIAEGMFTQPDRHLPGMIKVDNNVGGLNAGHLYKTNSLNCASLTNGMIWGRKIVREYEAFYKKYFKGFENLQLVTTAALMGVRESRRILGEYEINYDDYIARRKFPDQIAIYAKAVDLHPTSSDVQEYKKHRERMDSKDKKYGIGEYYGIPYGVLVPKGFKNFWVAGRCVSADVMVHASLRPQPSCSMMGQAAGTAAVQSIKTGQTANHLDTAVLVKTLREGNAYLPQETLSSEMTRA